MAIKISTVLGPWERKGGTNIISKKRKVETLVCCLALLYGESNCIDSDT